MNPLKKRKKNFKIRERRSINIFQVTFNSQFTNLYKSNFNTNKLASLKNSEIRCNSAQIIIFRTTLRIHCKTVIKHL